jgi:isoquinoline 1-oxidoreductase
MLYGKVLRPVALGAELESIDMHAANEVEGVTICRDGDFIGCVAETSYEASLAVDALASTAKWKRREQVASDQLFDHFKATASRSSSQSDQNQASETVEQELNVAYTIDYIQHAPMEPRAAVAEWTDGSLTVWTGTQQPDRVHGELARTFGLSPEQVRVIVPDTGGGFGGKHTGEVAVEAARLAKAADRPVHLRWTREEEFTWAYFRPAGLIEVKASLDDQHRIKSWDFTNYNSGGSAIDSPYRIPNSESRFVRTEYPLRQGSYRALASTANTFARESAMDELARMVREDPLAFRLRHLDDGRLKDVLLAAARKFSWEQTFGEQTPGHGVGLACGTEKGSFVAACVEVEVSGDEIKVAKVCQAFECGAVQNPNNLKAQVEGALIQGLGGALFESIEFSEGQIKTDNFSSYRVPRMSDVPELDIVLLNRLDLPSVGGSETPIIAIAPAIANAVTNACGTRSRSLPLRIS